jgi:hypothetical protein
MNKSSSERFPVITHFLLLLIAWWAATSAIYVWWAGQGWAAPTALALARFYVAIGLPSTSTVHIPVAGHFWYADQLIRAMARLPTVWLASTAVLVYLPVAAAALAAASLYLWRKKFPASPIDFVRGTRVVPHK